MNKHKIILGYLLLFLLFCIYCVCSPSIDIYLSKLPYNDANNKFYGEALWWCHFVYTLVPVIVVSIVVGLILLFIFKNKLRLNKAKVNKLVIVTLLSLAIGPGLISNAILKDNWGRPRPYQVLRDNQQFRPFYKPDFGKSQYNSFPSGHATIGFFLGVPLLALGRRKYGLIVSGCGGLIVGVVRMLQGGHYVSDVIFSGVIIWCVSEIIAYGYDKIIKNKG